MPGALLQQGGSRRVLLPFLVRAAVRPEGDGRLASHGRLLEAHAELADVGFQHFDGGGIDHGCRAVLVKVPPGERDADSPHR